MFDSLIHSFLQQFLLSATYQWTFLGSELNRAGSQAQSDGPNMGIRKVRAEFGVWPCKGMF